MSTDNLNEKTVVAALKVASKFGTPTSLEENVDLEKAYQENEILRRKYGDYVFYSSSMLFKPREGMVGRYRKMNPWMAVDKSFMTAGKDLFTYDTEYGRISMCVCFDIMSCLPLIKKQNVWAHFHSFAWVDEVCDNTLGNRADQPGASPAAVNGCWKCHGSKVTVDNTGKLEYPTWPNFGVGRINPDGSKGSCRQQINRQYAI